MNYWTLALVVFLMNLAPALMPATWTVLAFFYLQFHLELAPTVIIGATMATSGRLALYWRSKTWFRHLLSGEGKDNYAFLGAYINQRRKLTVTLVFLYAFLPIPSNQVLVAAGLAEADVRLFAFSFLFGRLLSYTFWVSVTSVLVGDIQTLVAEGLTSPQKVIIELAGLALLIGLRDCFLKAEKVGLAG